MVEILDQPEASEQKEERTMASDKILHVTEATFDAEVLKSKQLVLWISGPLGVGHAV